MKKLVLAAMLLLLSAGAASAEKINGQFLFHSKDGKAVGIKTGQGLMELMDGKEIAVNGVNSLDSFKMCDDVTVEYTANGKLHVVTAISLVRKAENTSCDQQLPAMTVAQFNKALADKTATIIDVRGPEEFAKGHLDGAINLPLGQVAANSAELPTDKPLLIYCHSGRRAGFAAGVLKQNGINASYVKGKFTIKDGKAQIIE